MLAKLYKKNIIFIGLGKKIEFEHDNDIYFKQNNE